MALVITVAYALMLTPFFSLRNDNIRFFLPTRLFISDALRHHEFLLWNPFLSGSYPMHSDMQGSVWNPIVLLLAWLFGYNHTVYSIEMLLYYILGTWGCYYLISNFTKNAYTCITLAICYGCCGFAASILEYMTWIESVAFLPWAAHFFYSLLKDKQPRSAIGLSVAMWLLLVCGYPSFLIVLIYGFLGALCVYFIKLYLENRKKEIIQLIKWLSVSAILSVGLSLPAIQSYLEFIAYYPRGEHASIDHLNTEKFSFPYLFSHLFPAGFLDNGSFTNFQDAAYIGLLPLIILIAQLRRIHFPSLRNLFLAIGSGFIFLFGIGRSTPLRIWSADHIPLLNKFGFSHSVRIFLVMAFFIWAVPGMDKLFNDPDKNYIRKIKKIAIYIAIALAIYLLITHRHNFKYNYSNTFYSLSLMCQFLLLMIIVFTPYSFFKKPKLIAGFIVIDMCTSVFLTIPITGLSLVRPSVYNHYTKEFYAKNANDYLLKKDSIPKPFFDPYRTINAFKTIPNNDFVSNTYLQSYELYISDINNYNRLLSLPFAFTNDSTPIKIDNIDLGYNHIDIDVQANADGQLVLQQNFYKRWKSRSADVKLSGYKGVLLQASIHKGENKIRLYYYRNDILLETLVSIICMITAFISVIYEYRKIRQK